MISDLILSLFAFYLYFQHRTQNQKWSLFFLFLGLSALVGGVCHGFTMIGEYFRFLSWSFLSIALVFAQLAAYQNNKNRIIETVFVLKSILLLFLSILNTNFEFMVFDTLISMLGFIVIGNLFFLKSLSKYISYGILISLSSAFFVIYKISIHPLYLTFNDIGHYISIISLIVMSRGVREETLKQLIKIEKS